jgi:hypothetical protein
LLYTKIYYRICIAYVPIYIIYMLLFTVQNTPRYYLSYISFIWALSCFHSSNKSYIAAYSSGKIVIQSFQQIQGYLIIYDMTLTIQTRPWPHYYHIYPWYARVWFIYLYNNTKWWYYALGSGKTLQFHDADIYKYFSAYVSPTSNIFCGCVGHDIGDGIKLV